MGAPIGDVARDLAPRLAALGNERRLLIVLLLAQAPRIGIDLQRATGLSQSLVSHHLKVLSDQGLVTITPYGRANEYALCCPPLVDLVHTVGMLVAEDGTGSPSRGAACGPNALKTIGGVS